MLIPVDLSIVAATCQHNSSKALQKFKETRTLQYTEVHTAYLIHGACRGLILVVERVSLVVC